jgi:transcriptional regulator with XRE-family HTH domain
MAIYSDNFGEVFSGILEKYGVSNYQISNYAHIDQAYLSRLKSGKKENPSPEVLIRICLALVYFSNKITLYDVEKLCNAVGKSLFTKKHDG